MRRRRTGQRLVRFLNHNNAALLGGCDAVRQASGRIGITTHADFALFIGSLQLNRAFHNEDEALRPRTNHLAARLEFRGVFGKSRTHCRADVHDRGASFHSWQRGADKCIGREQKVIRLVRASCAAEIMHFVSFFEIPTTQLTDREGAIRIGELLRRRRHLLSPPGRG